MILVFKWHIGIKPDSHCQGNYLNCFMFLICIFYCAECGTYLTAFIFIMAQERTKSLHFHFEDKWEVM